MGGDISNLVVSLTTYSTRIKTVHKTVESLLRQSFLPEQIILWLDREEFSLDVLPLSLKDLVGERFVILFCENLRSYKKLVPTINSYPGKNIVTVDDDLIYPSNLLEELYCAHLENPDFVICSRARLINATANDLCEYESWKPVKNQDDLMGFENVLPIGFGGIFYPNAILTEEFSLVDVFSRLAPSSDDIWFKAVQILNGVGCVVLGRSKIPSFSTIADTQDIALNFNVNINDENRDALARCLKYFDIKELSLKKIACSPLSISPSYFNRLSRFNGFLDSPDELFSVLRKAAQKLEVIDIRLALSLMENAKALRPKGTFVVNKVKEYRKRLESHDE